MSPNELSIGVIGTGRMGGFHVDAWDRIDTARVVAVADPSEEASRACVRRRQIDTHQDWHELLARPDIDAVTVAAPTEQHAQITLAALAAGKHVLVEKPVASTLEDGTRMAAAARATGRKLMVGHVERFNPVVDMTRRFVAEGRLGRILRINGTRVGPLPARIRDAGVAIDLAIHDLDVMQYVLGHDITSIYAAGGRFVHPSQEDMLTCLLRFGADGPFGMLDVNWVTPTGKRELTVIGEAGMLHADYVAQEIVFTESAGAAGAWQELEQLRDDAASAVVRFTLDRVDPLRAELTAFARCIIDDTDEPVSVYDGCRALVAGLAVRNSAATSRPVTLLGMPSAPLARRAA
jgi:UDP-N-acetylglucosamine 3-dehydrogenase